MHITINYNTDNDIKSDPAGGGMKCISVFILTIYSQGLHEDNMKLNLKNKNVIAIFILPEIQEKYRVLKSK